MTAYVKTDDLPRALAALTVQDVWRAVGFPDCPREGNHLVKSPFREDRKASFSICFKGAGWRDHATAEKGNVYAFAKRATGKDGKELVDFLIDLSGITRTPIERRTLNAERSTSNDEQFKPSRRAKPKPYPSPAVKARLAQEHALALESKVQRRDVPEWSASVMARWRQGSADTWDRVAALSSDRGWSESWTLQVHELDLLAYPLLPWCDTRRGREDELGVAFKVEAPFLNEFGDLVALRQIGYHQRFVIRGDKSWVYVPYAPAEAKCRSDFQWTLRLEAKDRGLDEGSEALVPGLPFVLSGGGQCSHLIITEGQWDAITFAGACGWLDSDTAWPEGWWVMGSRGSNGADTLLAYWGPWLRRWRPQVLLLADNDAASIGWDNARMAGEKAPWHGPWEPGVVPSFKEKLEHLGCTVAVRRVAASIGKDFNDYYKAKRPTPAAMAKWLSGVFDTPAKSA